MLRGTSRSFLSSLVVVLMLCGCVQGPSEIASDLSATRPSETPSLGEAENVSDSPSAAMVETPSTPENSDHGYRELALERIPKFSNCQRFLSWWKRGPVAVSFDARKASGLETIAVSTQVYQRNSKLDLDADGIICAESTDSNVKGVQESTTEADSENADSSDDSRSFEIQANEVSPSSVDNCKVPDARPAEFRRLPRGTVSGERRIAGPTGFPFVNDRFPTKGEANIVAVMVSFLDTNEFVENPMDFLGEQTSKITQWSNFWSQGRFRYKFQIVDEWVRLPIESSKAPRNEEDLARMILERLPKSVDFTNVDGTYIHWASGLIADSGGFDFAIRVGSNEKPFNVGDKRPGLVWAPSSWHSETTQNLTSDIKKNYTWSHWIHELLHEQGLNLHAPGNGWATGVGQNLYPNPSNGLAFSAALPAWELFLIEWLEDSQIHCVTKGDLTEPHLAILTPMEIYGGDRKALVVPLGENNEVLVVESRRPRGYTENWKSDEKGLVAYRVNTGLVSQDDHSSNDCGNDPSFPKWAYYVFPEGSSYSSQATCPWHGHNRLIVKEGQSISYGGVTVKLLASRNDEDVIQVSMTGLSASLNSINSRPNAANEDLFNEEFLRSRETRTSHCICCACTPD